LKERNKKLENLVLIGNSMKNRRKFNAKRAPAGQLKVRVDKACRSLLKKANGNPQGITEKMIQITAQKQGLSAMKIKEHLRQYKA